MTIKRNIISSIVLVKVLLVSLFLGCVDPITPEYDIKEGLVFVDALASSSPGGSYVTLSESTLKINANKFITGANVTFRNTVTGRTVQLIENEEIYLPPSDFVVSPDDSWELFIAMEDGREYRSLPEKVLEPTSIREISFRYDSKLVYRADSEDFVPGHSISVSIDNPLGKEDYFYWRFRSFEKILYCKKCWDGSILRDGECVPASIEEAYDRKDFYDYTCESACWKIRYGENINIFSDAFTNSPIIENLPIANVLLYTKNNILVEVQQFSIPPSTYEYYRVLKDLIDNNQGLNSPPPAALIGNVFNPNDDKEYVLGRFTAVAGSTKSIFIDRHDISESQIEVNPVRQFEVCDEVCPREACVPGYSPACYEITRTTCEENRYRTAYAPEGWID